MSRSIKKGRLMADVALSDGEVRPEEQQILYSLGKSSDLVPADVNHLINKRRSGILRQARARKKAGRRTSRPVSK